MTVENVEGTVHALSLSLLACLYKDTFTCHLNTSVIERGSCLTGHSDTTEEAWEEEKTYDPDP